MEIVYRFAYFFTPFWQRLNVDRTLSSFAFYLHFHRQLLSISTDFRICWVRPIRKVGKIVPGACKLVLKRKKRYWGKITVCGQTKADRPSDLPTNKPKVKTNFSPLVSCPNRTTGAKQAPSKVYKSETWIYNTWASCRKVESVQVMLSSPVQLQPPSHDPALKSSTYRCHQWTFVTVCNQIRCARFLESAPKQNKFKRKTKVIMLTWKGNCKPSGKQYIYCKNYHALID